MANRGSPPLARGIPIDDIVCRLGGRITPACAGNTYPPRLYMQIVRDHPRLRGEYCSLVQLVPYFVGSPPLARGILFTRAVGTVFCGITPACAGNTCPDS